MGASTEITWTTSTFNPWWGCQRVSPGCEHCYAETFSKRVGLKVWGPTTERRHFGDKHWAEPLKWDREAAKSGEPWRVFCASMADVFEDRRDLDADRARLWELIEATPALTWQLLTKRPENITRLYPWVLRDPPANVWLGTTTEDAQRLHERVRDLIRVPAVVHFLSAEPLLGPLGDLVEAIGIAMLDEDVMGNPLHGVDWLIVGGESGPGARPFDLAWARSIRDQCRDAGVACFVKQLGARPHSWTLEVDDIAPRQDWLRLKDRKGGDMSEWPSDLRIREFPRTP